MAEGFLFWALPLQFDMCPTKTATVLNAMIILYVAIDSSIT